MNISVCICFTSNTHILCFKSIIGHQPKGNNAFETPSENLCGLNSSASSPQNSGSWWTCRTGIMTSAPAGNAISPNLVFWSMHRNSMTRGGYNLSTSCNIMFTYNHKEHISTLLN
ncbi:hypothetical protein IHE45_17G084300 [Dioscorea alata]|uniref:Uncharacterized protein n=1 Tax=Dioscorea alata TaxID=55571 RepID=A0ACB7UDI5_DIOAL|nr:hypothetical protein IHE45_17G084300 [Dioscorea alata]